jgi:malate synthase
VEVCRTEFDRVLGERDNQLEHLRDDVSVSAADLLAVARTPGEITEAGLRNDVSVGLRYLASWLEGLGAVAIFNLMEDAATAEIARSQLWQWVHNDVSLAGGPAVTAPLVRQVVREEMDRLGADQPRFVKARELFEQVALADEFVEFLTLPAYEELD